MRADGSHRRKLKVGRTRNYQDHEPVWSPDGKKIAFWREPKSRREHSMVFIANADGTQATRLARGDSPAWSPDGHSLVFQAPHGLYVMGADGGEIRKLTTRGGMPDWSPDGKKVVFSYSAPHGRSALHMINIDGTGERVLAQGLAWNPKWSPDGDAILYSNRQGAWVLDMQSEHRRPLVSFSYGGGFSWSPDGHQIVFAVSTNWPNFDLGVISRDGSKRQRLTHTPLAEYSPDWTG